jgi:hypothetical protein
LLEPDCDEAVEPSAWKEAVSDLLQAESAKAKLTPVTVKIFFNIDTPE